jgi:hypothetical protein
MERLSLEKKGNLHALESIESGMGEDIRAGQQLQKHVDLEDRREKYGS